MLTDALLDRHAASVTCNATPDKNPRHRCGEGPRGLAARPPVATHPLAVSSIQSTTSSAGISPARKPAHQRLSRDPPVIERSSLAMSEAKAVPVVLNEPDLSHRGEKRPDL